jgi:FkbM family methyltransferase
VISYSDNGEDVLVARALGDVPTGCYIDVGAGTPRGSNMTRHFYDQGWRGVNIEPLPELHAELLEDRHEDICLQVVLGARAGRAVLYENRDNWGLSTLEDAHAAVYRSGAMAVVERDVEMMTLAGVCEEYVAGPIDFCKIDVEGHEQAVIEGGDWDRWRPRIVVVEATVPMSRSRTDTAWRDLLLRHGYLEAYFDGLNVYFVAEEDQDLIPVLAVQPNWFDHATPYREVLLHQHVEDLEHRLEFVVSQLDALGAELGNVSDQRDQVSTFAVQVEQHAKYLTGLLHGEQRARADESARAEELERALQVQAHAIEELRATVSALDTDAERLRAAADELDRVRRRRAYVLADRVAQRLVQHPALDRSARRVTRRFGGDPPKA